MDLSHEDALRLNVLLASGVQAIRIDESAMAVHALNGEGVSTVKLNPTGRDESYLRRVRELISTHVLGSPGGYPVYLRRWTRMGQARDESLERLLMLGEPEAVVAVVGANGLTTELARRAWWAMPDAENARRMLRRDCVVCTDLGRELAAHLLEYLPFETEPQAMIDSVRLMLQPGLISDEERAQLWTKARHKNAYYVGFLRAVPDALPDPLPAHPAWEAHAATLEALATRGNAHAAQLARLLQAHGQTWLSTVEAVLRKPANQDVVVELMETVAAYFSPLREERPELQDMALIIEAAERLCDPDSDLPAPTELAELLEAAPALGAEIRAMTALAQVGEPVLVPIFARTDAIGTVMRRKLEPVTRPLLEQMAVLRGAGGGA